MDALQYLQEMQEDGAIRHLALTNFDTKHMVRLPLCYALRSVV